MSELPVVATSGPVDAAPLFELWKQIGFRNARPPNGPVTAELRDVGNQYVSVAGEGIRAK